MRPCQPLADWLAQSFGRAAGASAVMTVEDRMIPMPSTIPPKPRGQGRKFDPLTTPLPASLAQTVATRRDRCRAAAAFRAVGSAKARGSARANPKAEAMAEPEGADRPSRRRRMDRRCSKARGSANACGSTKASGSATLPGTCGRSGKCAALTKRQPPSSRKRP